MSLLTDPGVIDESDLRLRDSNILEVASQEQVDLRAKIGLAQTEISDRIEYLLRACATATAASPGNVVMTEGLKRWLSYYALELVYQDVHFSQLNDRYGHRWAEYRRRAAEAERAYTIQGIGVTLDPLPPPAGPAALLESGGLPSATYHLQVRWVNSKGEESGPSPTVTVAANGFHALRVSVSGPPPSASGWNLYAGTTASPLFRQNSAALALAQQWDHTAGEIEETPLVVQHQKPTLYLFPNRELRRRY